MRLKRAGARRLVPGAILVPSVLAKRRGPFEINPLHELSHRIFNKGMWKARSRRFRNRQRGKDRLESPILLEARPCGPLARDVHLWMGNRRS